MMRRLMKDLKDMEMKTMKKTSSKSSKALTIRESKVDLKASISVFGLLCGAPLWLTWELQHPVSPHRGSHLAKEPLGSLPQFP